ncbi:uncharacterized protein Z518_11151 [Rhinocladiella mackenziei CBS 650.93]|uniref:C2H2-type domain-containing protein n=1 Tax=Rhinocladiella mackenziei CBS 650.93 TaxID=1442369 RepID=A0A0D2I1X1_9EURO|nr:uncharacterized protein Z518_11151 [Rhinocladiella mackenziei CBS 650.93]KIW99738.1 hypothetical protein Z518_11151 [Rhinocladiella mackenziei CBS 650.93]
MADHFSFNVCATCSKSYKRPEHLRRHQLSHGSERPYQCALCGKTFQRSDVLKRHLRTCDNVAGFTSQRLEPIPKRVALSNPNSPRDIGLTLSGPHEVQSQLQTRDSQELWLENTSSDSFGHMNGWISCGLSDNGLDGPFDDCQEFLNLNPGTQTPRTAWDGTDEGTGFLSFLDTFTSKTGLVASFDCGTIEHRRRVNAFSPPAATGCGPARSSPSSLRPADSFNTSGDDAPYSEGSETTLSRWLSDPLSFKSHEIVACIGDTVFHKPRKSCTTLPWSPTVQETCARFFSPTNIRRYIQLYWAIWHPNVNIVHMPTFDPASTKPELLAAMTLIGACVSPDRTDIENAKRWFNCVEEMVFDDADFCNDAPNPVCRDTGEVQWRREKLRALQASYIVCLYQNWEGTNSSKRRIRRHRFSMVIAAARDIGIHNARHPIYGQMDFCDFSFSNFATIEELIRVFTWIFLLDTAFVIFNNLPPRMVIREMTMNTACSEACFQALTAEECFETLQQEQRNDALRLRVSNDFTSAFDLLYRTDLDDILTCALADLGPLNLFAMSSALHSLIFHYQSSFSCQGSLDSIQNALRAWKKVWHVYTTHFSQDSRHSTVKCSMDLLTPDHMWRRVGFMRHANEYWHLANLIVERLSAPLTEDTDIMDAAGEAQSSFSISGNGPISPLLQKYDETSMQQVNILISDFRKVRIN